MNPRPACDGANVSLFYPFDGEQPHEMLPRLIPVARFYCEDCPLRQACKVDADERGERWGLWGGHLYRERRKPVDLLATNPMIVSTGQGRVCSRGHRISTPDSQGRYRCRVCALANERRRRGSQKEDAA